ncbi:hypothetical protein SAMN02745126_06031 [Enhydrobacter aerosaccus]|uniref:Uncharacterized protein n=1 Tax=Enhydrobacter aerosaccus TaxID=225324 RepID=A0A1T4TCW3_9HYPH|nr:hypothetical protein [Enhydrobacter aerosaccus]SKA38257.1 hypothetical protein SAMN02745126_06031 [Enhydrobacter aerosaccus]
MNQKHSRLRSELQEAYRGWLNSSPEARELAVGHEPRIDIAGYPDANTAEWFAYLAAKSRLVKAYAERADLQKRLEA